MPAPSLPGRTRPTEIRHVHERALVRITWSDGHVGEYPYAFLRGWCPCAGCQGHGNDQHFLSVPDAVLTGIQAVGNYALSFTWAGGHDTGIYSYAYLRKLCPCAECIAARPLTPAHDS